MGAIADPTLTLVRRNEVRPDCMPNFRFRPEKKIRFRQSLQKSRMLSKFVYVLRVCRVTIRVFLFIKCVNVCRRLFACNGYVNSMFLISMLEVLECFGY